MLERKSRTSQLWYPTRYESTKNQFNLGDRYIAGQTREEMSQYITNFPFIYHIYKKNTPNDQWKLLDELMKVPSETDGPGFIYGFMNQKENSLLEAPYWIKIGRTKQNPPQQRIFQWERDDCIQITEIFTVRTLYQKKLQSLIHTLFAYARKNRQINGKNRIEWFHFQQITLTAAAVNILNHIMNTIHTSKIQNKQKIYMNRNLKQITDKITQSNNQMNDILATAPKLVVESFVRDLGIQLGKKDQVKIKLKDCEDLDKAIGLLEESAIGKQMKQFLNRITQMEDIIGKYLDNVAAYRKETLLNIKQIYDKTKINLVNYDSKSANKINTLQQPKQKKQTKVTPKKSKQQKPSKSPYSKKTSPKQKKSSKKTQTTNQIRHENKEEVSSLDQKLKQMSLYANIENYYALDQQMGKMNIQDNGKYETVTVQVYNSEGKQQRKQQISIKQLQHNPLKKYKQNSVQPPKANEQLQKNNQHYAYSEQSNQSLNETFINQNRASEEIQNTSSQKVIKIQAKTKKMSQIINQYQLTQVGRVFIIFTTQQFLFDHTKLKLDYNYFILTRKLKIDKSFSIMRSDKFKGLFYVFSQEIQGIENFQINQKCQKYVGIYQVLVGSSLQITPVDEYHKNKGVDQNIKVSFQRCMEHFQHS